MENYTVVWKLKSNINLYFEILILEALTFRQTRKREIMIHQLEMRTESLFTPKFGRQCYRVLITNENSKKPTQAMKITKVSNIHQTIYFYLLILPVIPLWGRSFRLICFWQLISSSCWCPATNFSLGFFFVKSYQWVAGSALSSWLLR